MLKEKNFKPLSKVSKKSLRTEKLSVFIGFTKSVFLFQRFTASCWVWRQKWTTRTRKSRHYATAWLKRWCPRSGWSSKWWSWWSCLSTACRTTLCRSRFRWASVDCIQSSCIIITFKFALISKTASVSLCSSNLFLIGTHEWKQSSSGSGGDVASPEWEPAGPDLVAGMGQLHLYMCKSKIRFKPTYLL